MKTVFLVIFVGLAFSSASIAYSDTPEVKIVGRGVRNSDLGESIALACLDPLCTELKHVLITDRSPVPVYFGPQIMVTPEETPSTDREIKAAVKRVNREYKTYRKNDPARQDRKLTWIRIILISFLLGGFVAPVIITQGAIVSGKWGISVFLSALAVEGAVVTIHSRVPFSAQTGIVSSVFANQNGWNWTESPREIRQKKFLDYKKFVEQMEPLGMSILVRSK